MGFGRGWQGLTERTLIIAIITLPYTIAYQLYSDAGPIRTHELIIRADQGGRHRCVSWAKFTLVLALQTIVFAIANFNMRHTAAVHTRELAHATFGFWRSQSGKGLTKGFLIVTLTTIPATVANMDLRNTMSIIAQELVTLAQLGRDGCRCSRTVRSLIFAQLTMPSSVTDKDLLNASRIRTSKFIVFTRQRCRRGGLGTTESCLVFTLFTIPASIANPFVRNARSVAHTKEFVQ